MKTQFLTIFQFLCLSAVLIFSGCKEKKPSEDQPKENPEIQRVDFEEEQEEIINTVLNAQGAAIRLTVTDAESLFNIQDPSVIDDMHPGLQYISMNSEGQKPEDAAETNDTVSAKGFESSVYKGRTAIWQFRLDQTVPNNRNYTIDVQEIDFREDSDNPCQAFEDVRYPRGNPAMVKAKVSNTASIGCRQPYYIIFSLYHNDKDISRTFVLDPWVLVRR